MYYPPDRKDVLEQGDLAALRGMELQRFGPEQRVILTFALSPNKVYGPTEAPEMICLTDGTAPRVYRVEYIPLSHLTPPVDPPAPEIASEPPPAAPEAPVVGLTLDDGANGTEPSNVPPEAAVKTPRKRPAPKAPAPAPASDPVAEPPAPAAPPAPPVADVPPSPAPEAPTVVPAAPVAPDAPAATAPTEAQA